MRAAPRLFEDSTLGPRMQMLHVLTATGTCRTRRRSCSCLVPLSAQPFVGAELRARQVGPAITASNPHGCSACLLTALARICRACRSPDRLAVTVSHETTIHLHKHLHGVTFKKKAPRAIREIKKFASKFMRTSDVRVDTDLNKYVWNKGVRNVPFRVRVRLSRQRNEDEDAAEKMYTLVELVEVPSFKGLLTTKGDAQ